MIELLLFVCYGGLVLIRCTLLWKEVAGNVAGVEISESTGALFMSQKVEISVVQRGDQHILTVVATFCSMPTEQIDPRLGVCVACYTPTMSLVSF